MPPRDQRVIYITARALASCARGQGSVSVVGGARDDSGQLVATGEIDRAIVDREQLLSQWAGPQMTSHMAAASRRFFCAIKFRVDVVVGHGRVLVGPVAQRQPL